MGIIRRSVFNMLNIVNAQILSKYPLQLTPTSGTAISHPNIRRDILLHGNYKFFEKVDFGLNGNKFAVAIGYNPSSASTNTALDQTNRKLVNKFTALGYDGYYLLNLYPEINSKKVNSGAVPFNKQFYEIIGSSLFQYSTSYNDSLDVYIFWGRSVPLSRKKIAALGTGLVNHNIYILINATIVLHEHPSYLSITNIAFKTFSLPLTHKIRQ